MEATMKVNILGAEYEIIKKRYDEEEAFSRRGIDGYCDGFTKKIVYCDMSTYKGWEHEATDTIAANEKHTLRHEIVHAFFNESGLSDSSGQWDVGWAVNEEMVDWIAAQGPKLYAAWWAAGAI